MTLPPIPFTHPFKVGDRIRDLYDRRESVVTELTPRGFKYEYDVPVSFIPRLGMSFIGGEVYLDMPESKLLRYEKVEDHPDFSVSP